MFAFLAIFLSLALCTVLLLVARHTTWLSLRDDLGAVQATHTREAPRLGGAVVVLSAVACIVFLPTDEARNLAAMILLSSMPVFIAGLLEDLGFGVSPKRRLLAAAVSSVFAILLTGTWIRAAGMPGIDGLLAIMPIGIAITILWTSGLCHATNLIDGMNGLAGGFSTLAALGLAGLAWSAGDPAVAYTCLLLAATIIGFLALNWPFGRVFLGDAGAYSIGHLLAWCGIVLSWRNPEVTGTAVALVFFWPIADTLFAMLRRRTEGKPMDQPDRMHVHQVVMRGLEIVGMGRRRRHISNPLTTVILLPFMALPIMFAQILANHGVLAFITWFVFAALFVAKYRLGAKLARGRLNPLHVVRSAPTVPVHDEAVVGPKGSDDSAHLVLEIAPDVRIMRLNACAHWTAYVRDGSGRWSKLDRSFPSRANAIKAAERVKHSRRHQAYAAQEMSTAS